MAPNRVRRRVGIWVAAVLALVAWTGTVAPATASAATPAQDARTHAKVIADIFDRHNAERVKAGLPKFKLAPAVGEQIIQPWMQKQARDRTLVHGTDYLWPGATIAGENIAYAGRGADFTRMWMNSPDHRDNILLPEFTVMTVGVAENSGTLYAGTNFYAGRLQNPGPLYSTGQEWLNAIGYSVYTVPGHHESAGRQWRTWCEEYSSVVRRCWTEIQVGSAWVFNNLTYLPSARGQWANNPLGNRGTWTSEGRQWKTDCDSAATGRNGCRSYMLINGTWTFNNLVLFSVAGQAPMHVDTAWRP